MATERYNAPDREPHWQKVWEERDCFRTKPIRRSRSAMCSRCSPIRRGASIWGTCATIPWAMCWPATSARAASMCSIRWAGTPSGCRPRTPPWSARRIRQLDLRQHRRDEGPAQVDGARHRLDQRVRDLRSELLPPSAAPVPGHVRKGSRVSAVEQGQLGPGRPYRARQRAGHRRPRLAIGRAGRTARADAVGVQDHRIRRRPARSAGHPRQVAGKSPPHAGELDRPLGRAAGPVGAGCRDRAEGRDRARGFHDPPGHALRRLVPGDRARPSAGAGRGRDQSCRRCVRRRVPAHGHLRRGPRKR